MLIVEVTPNLSLERTSTGKAHGPRGGQGISSASRPKCLAGGVRSAQTLGIRATIRRSSQQFIATSSSPSHGAPQRGDGGQNRQAQAPARREPGQPTEEALMNESITPVQSGVSLRARSQPSVELKGVRGWLLALCLMLTVVGPVISAPHLLPPVQLPCRLRFSRHFSFPHVLWRSARMQACASGSSAGTRPPRLRAHCCSAWPSTSLRQRFKSPLRKIRAIACSFR
jgi:hypothetical protein